LSICDGEQELEREPTPEEVAQSLNMSMRKVKRLMQASSQPISIEQPLNHDREGCVGELLADERLEAPIEIAAQHMLQQELTEALNELPERERKGAVAAVWLDRWSTPHPGRSRSCFWYYT